MSSPLGIWKAIPDSIAKESHVFSYDRAGIGKSEQTKAQRTVPNMVEELREVLKKEKIGPPIYLCGSFYGILFGTVLCDDLS